MPDSVDANLVMLQASMVLQVLSTRTCTGLKNYLNLLDEMRQRVDFYFIDYRISMSSGDATSGYCEF